MIILISDGYSSDLSGGEDMRIAELLRKDGIALYGIHVASGEVPGQVVNISTLSGGELFEAGDRRAGHGLPAHRRDAGEDREGRGRGARRLPSRAWVGLGLLGAFALLGFFLRVTPW